jgi:hypothetical protein
MNHLSSATQQTASASEELSATAEELSAQAQGLQDLMGRFRLADDGSAPAVPARAKAAVASAGGLEFGHARVGRARAPGRKAGATAAIDESAFMSF